MSAETTKMQDRKDFNTMSIKKLVVAGSIAIALGVMLFAGCAKPPTAKVTTLTEEFNKLQAAGAQVFARDQYDQVNAQMASLQSLMDQKKYKEATALCDTITTAIEALKSAVDTQGAEIAKTEVASATEEIAKMKTLVTDNAKALGAEDGKKLQDQIAALESQAGALQGEIDNKNFMNAFNTAKSIKDQIAAATQQVTTKLEEAKAKKGAKPAAKPAKK